MHDGACLQIMGEICGYRLYLNGIVPACLLGDHVETTKGVWGLCIVM